MARFQAIFPELTYDVEFGVDVANAQAFVEGSTKHVRLYGGLVRHRKVGSAGLAVVLAHETGHHLAGPPYLRFCGHLSSEERATEWAIEVGLAKVFGRKAAQTIGASGNSQLRALRVGE